MAKWFTGGERLAPVVLLAAAALAQDSGRVVLFDEIVRIERAQWRVVSSSVMLKHRPGTVEVDYTVVRGNPGVRAMLMTRQDVDRYRNGKSSRVLAATEPNRGGKVRFLVTRPGDYMVLLDNRQEGRGAALVQLRVGLAFDREHVSFEPGRLPDGRRRLVVAVSLLGFAVVGGWSGWRLWMATVRRRRSPEPLPPFG
jgi:hypothetical protein